MDEFQFGAPARSRRLFRHRTTQDTPGPRLVLLVTGLVIAGVLSYVFLRGDQAGDRLADAGTRAVSQVDRAYDAEAQGTLGQAVVIAQSGHAERGSFPQDLATLAAADPSITFIAGPSDGPAAVSYAVGQRGFAAAVRSGSGTCWWVRIDPEGATSYGSGTACTGRAAMAASAPGW